MLGLSRPEAIDGQPGQRLFAGPRWSAALAAAQAGQARRSSSSTARRTRRPQTRTTTPARTRARCAPRSRRWPASRTGGSPLRAGPPRADDHRGERHAQRAYQRQGPRLHERARSDHCAALRDRPPARPSTPWRPRATPWSMASPSPAPTLAWRSQGDGVLVRRNWFGMTLAEVAAGNDTGSDRRRQRDRRWDRRVLERNVFARNTGIRTGAAYGDDNKITGNYFGTDASGVECRTQQERHRGRAVRGDGRVDRHPDRRHGHRSGADNSGMRRCMQPDRSGSDGTGQPRVRRRHRSLRRRHPAYEFPGADNTTIKGTATSASRTTASSATRTRPSRRHARRYPLIKGLTPAIATRPPW